MDATEPSRRWWFTHEQTVLLVIALMAALGLGWLGMEVHTVRHRRAMRARIEAGGGRVCVFVAEWMVLTGETGPPVFGDRRIPRVRELLGDTAIALIRPAHALTAFDREAMAAFPEAEIGSPLDPGK
jgi:hypothetical protein